MNWFTKETDYAPFYLVLLRAAGMCLGLAFLSFLNHAAVATMIAVLIYSVWCYLRPSNIEGRPNGFAGYASARYVQGILPGLIATSILQMCYFIGGLDLFPITVAFVLFVANFFLYVLISFLGVGIGELWLWHAKSKKTNSPEKKRQELSSQFEDRIKQLTVFILLVYVQMHIILPVTSTVHASEKVTVDEFIETYDPEKKYEITSEIKDENVSQKMPVDEVILKQEGDDTFREKKPTAVEEFIQQEQKRLDWEGKKKMEALKKQALSLEQLESTLKKGEITLLQFLSLSAEGIKNGSISLPSVYAYVLQKMTQIGLDNDIRKSIRNYLFSLANPAAAIQLIYLINKKTDGGLLHAGIEFTKRVGEKIGEGVTWVKENPKEAAIGAVVIVGVIILTAVCPPAGAAVALVLAGIGLGLTGATLYDAYNTDGWNGVRREIISDETVSMWQQGDYTGAIGRGSVEAGVFVLMNLPTLGANQVGKIGQLKNAITGLTKIRGSISVAIEGGEVSVQGARILKGVFKGISHDAALIRHVTILLADPKSSFAILLNKQSAAVLNAKGAEKSAVKAANKLLITNAKEGYTKLPVEYKLDWKSYTRNGESRIEHIKKHENFNYSKFDHGVFYADSQEVTNKAWLKKGNLKPIKQGNRDVYHIYYPNAGYANGIKGQGQNLNYVTIVTEGNSNILVTSFPSYGQ